jgi:hypothetical protein
MMTADGGAMAGMAAPTVDAGLVAALSRVAAALERLADGGAAGRPHGAAVPVHDGDVRAARLDGGSSGVGRLTGRGAAQSGPQTQRLRVNGFRRFWALSGPGVGHFWPSAGRCQAKLAQGWASRG